MEISDTANCSIEKVAGLLLVRQCPGTAKGVSFISIEDESGFANLVVIENIFESYRKEILNAKLLMVKGKLHREGEVEHVIVSKCFDFTKLLKESTSKIEDQLSLLPLPCSDEKIVSYYSSLKHPQLAKACKQAIFS